MDRTLAFVEIQLWVVICLQVVFFLTNFLCNLYNRRRQGSEPFKPNFKYLWERNELDKLLEVSAKYRSQFPNSADAHYFAIKALLAKSRFLEARVLVGHLAQIEPTLKTAVAEWLLVIEQGIAS